MLNAATQSLLDWLGFGANPFAWTSPTFTKQLLVVTLFFFIGCY